MKKQVLKSTILLSLIATALTACNGGGNNTNIKGANSGIPSSIASKVANNSPSQPFYSLGSGYIRDLKQLVSSTPVFNIEDTDSVSVTSPSSNFKFASDASNSQILSKLGISGSIHGEIGKASGDITLDEFLNSDKADENSLSYYISNDASAVAKLENKYYVPFAISPTDQKYHPERETYGDNYINSLRMGIFASLKISITSSSKEAIQSIKGSLKGSYADIASLNAALDMLDKSIKNSIEVKVDALQLGGDVGQLAAALGTPTESTIHGGIYDCSLSESGLAACHDLMNKFAKYSADRTVGLSAQFDKYVTALTLKSPTYKDLKILFPLNNSIDTLSLNAVGKYYNTESQTQSNNVIKVSPEYVSAINTADSNYRKITQGTLEPLLQIKTLTGGEWNKVQVNNLIHGITAVTDDMIALLKNSCLTSNVADDDGLQQVCIKLLNEKGDIINRLSDEYNTNVYNKFKGYKIFTTIGGAGKNTNEYLVPEPTNPKQFIDVVYPYNLALAKFNPLGTWQITTDVKGNKLLNLAFGYNLIVSQTIIDQQYTAVKPGLNVGFSDDNLSMMLTGKIQRESEPNKSIDLDNTSFALYNIL